MSYHIVWEAQCFEEIGRLLAARFPAEPIKAVIQHIATELEQSPEMKGRELSEGLRRLDAPPFRVYFFVDEKIERVTITVLHFQP